MSCKGCSVSANGAPSGCGSKGNCMTGGCNRLNTFDWLMDVQAPSSDDFDLVEVSFKNGSRKDFFHNPPHVRAITGDNVVVESGSGFDVGIITLSGELVKLQMKKKKIREGSIFSKLVRLANQRDMERLHEAREIEYDSMLKARRIARDLGLEMKIGDVEYQADKRKATFFYTADGRVDFRELIRHFAKEFRVKIEMRQIGARQESAKIGGLGSCGRELCCSTWLSDFKSVTTTAARYQNIAINQSKLSGQCGRLKCCLNFELDTYMDALKDFPKHADSLLAQGGKAYLIKTDIFKRLMFYSIRNENGRAKFMTLSVERVKEVLAMNKLGEKPLTLEDKSLSFLNDDEESEVDFADDVTGVIELPMEKSRSRRNRGNNRRKPKGNDNRSNKDKKPANKPNPNRKKKNTKPTENKTTEVKDTSKDVSKDKKWDARPPRKSRRNSRPKTQEGDKSTPLENKTTDAKSENNAGNENKANPRSRKPRPPRNKNRRNNRNKPNEENKDKQPPKE